MKAIPFFTDTIKIVPHSATLAENLDRPISIREFAGGRPVSLYELENGELRAVVRMHGAGGLDDFIEGPEDAEQEFSLVYLGTSLPDYFQGFAGHTYAIPLSRKPRVHEVKRGLLDAISSEELFVDGCSVGEGVYDALRDVAEELFMGQSPLSAWVKSADDLSESYAYFGVKVS